MTNTAPGPIAGSSAAGGGSGKAGLELECGPGYHLYPPLPGMKASPETSQGILRHSYSVVSIGAGGRGPLRLPAPSPARPQPAAFSRGRGGGQSCCRPAAEDHWRSQLLHKLSACTTGTMAQGWNFLSRCHTMLPVPSAACSLDVNWHSLPQGGKLLAAKRGLPQSPGTSQDSQDLPWPQAQGLSLCTFSCWLILAGMHFDLCSLCAPLPHSSGPLGVRTCLSQTSCLCSSTLLPSRLLRFSRPK